MNSTILKDEVQAFITANVKANANAIALAKSSFEGVSSSEIAGQIASKQKSIDKLPTWYKTPKIYFPPLLSIEQCSSETTAAYKAKLGVGKNLIDLTAGFGVDSYYFSKQIESVWSCEINTELSAIAAHNAQLLKAENIKAMAVDGIEWLNDTPQHFDTIYIDPARRLNSGKVFKLSDCTPNVVVNLSLLLSKAERVIIKTAPLLDITAGLSELQNVSEIHIVSVKNECKELLWILDRQFTGNTSIVCSTLNEKTKTISFALEEIPTEVSFTVDEPSGYLYEPDVAILKSGAFNWIGTKFGIQKLNPQSHLYTSHQFNPEFPGRIFEIERVLSLNELKKQKNLIGNVIVRNFPERAENLVKKYKIVPSHDNFLVFTQIPKGYIAIAAKIIQHY